MFPKGFSMKSCPSLSFFAVLFCSVFIFSKTLLAADGRIEKVVYTNSENNVESVVFYLNGPHLPKAFALKGARPRVVFDFFGTMLDSQVPAIIQANGIVVKKVRLGRHSDKTRVVIDLNSTEGFHFEKQFDDTKNILSILLFTDNTPLEALSNEVPTESVPAEPEILPVDSIPAKEEVFRSPASVEEIAPVVETATVMTDAQANTSVEIEVTESAPLEPVIESDKKVEEDRDKIEPGKTTLLDPLLTDVSFENTSNNGEMVLFKLNGFFPPTVSGEEIGDPRVICKFPGTRLSDKIIKDQEVNGNFVKRIRVEQFATANEIQVTLELVPNNNYDLQQVFFKEDNLFVVIVNSFDSQDTSTNNTPALE